jgi:hypothetical protein
LYLGLCVDEVRREIGFRPLVGQIRRNAAVRGYSFDLSDDEIAEICARPCAYCNAAPSMKIKDYVYNGIDRVDPSRGYARDNVVPCCKTCNIAKNTMSRDEFFAWVDSVHRYSFKRIENSREANPGDHVPAGLVSHTSQRRSPTRMVSGASASRAKASDHSGPQPSTQTRFDASGVKLPSA